MVVARIAFAVTTAAHMEARLLKTRTVAPNALAGHAAAVALQGQRLHLVKSMESTLIMSAEIGGVEALLVTGDEPLSLLDQMRRAAARHPGAVIRYRQGSHRFHPLVVDSTLNPMARRRAAVERQWKIVVQIRSLFTWGLDRYFFIPNVDRGPPRVRTLSCGSHSTLADVADLLMARWDPGEKGMPRQ